MDPVTPKTMFFFPRINGPSFGRLGHLTANPWHLAKGLGGSLHVKNGLSLALTFRHWPLRWGVLLRAGRVLMVVTLMTMIGGHWALLQTIAWTGMMADHLQTSSVCDALSTTLD